MSGDSDWLIILLLLIPTSTMWFSLDCNNQNQGIKQAES